MLIAPSMECLPTYTCGLTLLLYLANCVGWVSRQNSLRCDDRLCQVTCLPTTDILFPTEISASVIVFTFLYKNMLLTP